MVFESPSVISPELRLPRLVERLEVKISKRTVTQRLGRCERLRDRPPTHDIVAARPPIRITLPHCIRPIAGTVIEFDLGGQEPVERVRHDVRRLMKWLIAVVFVFHRVLLKERPKLRHPGRSQRRGRPCIRQLEICIVMVLHRQAVLLQIVRARRPPGRLTRRLYRGKQERDQHADNGNHDQKFHEGEAATNANRQG
jgi:hypothetical protein